MIKVALLGDSITEYMPYRIDNNMNFYIEDKYHKFQRILK